MNRLTVYLRGAVVLLVVGAIGLVLFKNRHYSVNLWFFGLTDANKPVNVVWVMVWTAGITRAAWWVFSFTRGLIRDYRQMKSDRQAAEVERMRLQRAAELDERERRLDDKLKRAADGISEESGE